MSKYLETALLAAKKAGKIFKANFGQPKKVGIKGNDKRDFITEVDLSLEKLIRKQIGGAFPNHKFIGEEMGLDNIGKRDLFWIIDPIDGTANFIHGVPFCCISIALWNKDGPLVGVVYNPKTDDLYSAERGSKAYLNKKLITISKAKSLDECFGAIGWGRDMNLAKKVSTTILPKTNKIRVTGSAALDVCMVGSGNFDFYVHGKLNIWDIGAGALIVTEAGGIITDWQGKKITPQTTNIIAAGSSKLHLELLKLAKTIK